jgi:16S rRNA processing protein RimM
MEQVVLCKIVAPHGVRGDLRIMPLTSNTQLFMDMDYLLLPDDRRLQIVKARPHKNIMLVTVKEVTSIEEAEMLRGLKVSVYREDMPELPEGRYYVGDLIGLPVLDEEGGQIGVFKDVLQTGSRDVYVIQPPEGKDILVANIPENIREIDLPNRRIIVRLPEWDEEEIR